MAVLVLLRPAIFLPSREPLNRLTEFRELSGGYHVITAIYWFFVVLQFVLTVVIRVLRLARVTDTATVTMTRIGGMAAASRVGSCGGFLSRIQYHHAAPTIIAVGKMRSATGTMRSLSFQSVDARAVMATP